MSSKDCKKSENMTSEEFTKSKFYNIGEHAPYKKSNIDVRYNAINNTVVANLFGRPSRHTDNVSQPIPIINTKKIDK